jgi:oxygen-independent coproporphyrinogen-3 oxidase
MLHAPILPYANPSTGGLPIRFGIYVHIPFCVHKCSYCDFYSFTNYRDQEFAPFIDLLTKDIARKAEWLRQNGGALPVSPVFLGGGTPSLIPTSLLQQIFEFLAKHFSFEKSAEFTLEANPETLSLVKVREWKQLTPINRVSLGAQSFHPRYLKALERRTTPEQVRAAATMLKGEGFENFNIDLIFGIPGQALDEMKDDVAAACALNPHHLSSYQLSLKPAHALYSQLPTSDTCAELYQALIEDLSSRGYRQYEISNFAKPGFECRHNLLYWQGGEFLGIGPSAASRVFRGGHFLHHKERSDVKLFGEEVSRAKEPQFEKTSRAQTILEATFLELRCNEGVDIEQFAAKYGYELDKAKKYPLFLGEGILIRNENRLRLSPRGRMLADTVTSELVDV